MADDVYKLMQQLQRPDYGSIQPSIDPRTKRVEGIANMLQALGLARTPRDAFRMANKINTSKDAVREFLPGESYKLAQERGDKLGQGLAMIDMIPGGGLLTAPVKVAKKTRLQRAKDMGFRIDEPVYHGTHAKNIDEFDDKFIGNRDDGFYGRGHYFTSESGEASYYGPNVGEYFTRGKLLDLSQTKQNSNYELMDKDYFKFWTKELDKIDMLDEPTKKGLKTINKIDDYVDKNVKIIKADDAYGNEGVAAYVKNPTKTNDLERIYSNFGVADKETAIKSLKDNIINETRFNSDLRKIYPDLDNTLFSLTDYIRVGGKGAAELTEKAKKAGYDGIKVSDETVIFDPKNIRSKDAKFDPKKTESPNLQSSLTPPSNIGLLGLLDNKRIV